MKIIFFGTPDYAIPILKALAKHYEISAVITQAPKPVGRKQLLQYSAVDTWAFKRKIAIFHSTGELVKKGASAELGILAAYGEKIPKNVIASFTHGILNIHPSLLPLYRGASPIQAAIASGDSQTGVSIIKMDEELDHGPIVSQFKEEINPNDTTGSLRRRLFERSAQVLIDLIPNYLKGKIKSREQDHDKATFTKSLKKEDGFVDLKKAKPQEAERFIRAMDPWPGCWTYVQLAEDLKHKAKRLKILKAHIERSALDVEHLVLDEVQLEGKNPVSWKQFSEAYPNSAFSL